MNQLVFSKSLFSYMKQGLFAEGTIESCAVLFMSRSSYNTATRFLVREVVIAPPEVYEHRTNRFAQLKSPFIADLVQRARKNDLSVCFVHTHISGAAHFSETDTLGERKLLPFLQRRTNTLEHVSMVLTQDGMSARMLGAGDAVTVRCVGMNVDRSHLDYGYKPFERYDRQIRTFGAAGQSLLSHQTVGIVGVGGTGSVVAQSLAYLGVERFLLIDFDTVSITNLNRLVGATYEDVGRLKVDVVADNIKRIQSKATVEVLKGDVTDLQVSINLRNTDFVFGCTDSHASRAVLNQFAYQYLTPVIDMGVSLVGKENEIKRITGRVQMLSPDLGCLVCGNLLDYDQVRWGFMNVQERTADPYFIGDGEPAPAVVSINSTVASLAVTMFLSAVVGTPLEPRMQIYDGIKGTVRAVKVKPVGGCVVCSSFGSLAQGDGVMLPGREVTR